MLKQRVIINGPAGVLTGREGIVVIERLTSCQGRNLKKGKVEYKVIVDNEISDWIPLHWLHLVPNSFTGDEDEPACGKYTPISSYNTIGYCNI